MKIIKFRGKRLDNGELICGDLLHYGKYEMCIRSYLSPYKNSFSTLPVDSNSIAQFVGYDVDGNEIYEGDVCISKYVIEEKAKLVSDFLNINGEDDSQHFSYYKLKGK